jgi:hypothetical protein
MKMVSRTPIESLGIMESTEALYSYLSALVIEGIKRKNNIVIIIFMGQPPYRRIW